MVSVHKATAVPLATHVTPAFLMNSYELQKHSAVQAVSGFTVRCCVCRGRAILVFQKRTACCLSVGGSKDVPGTGVSWDSLRQLKVANYPNDMRNS